MDQNDGDDVRGAVSGSGDCCQEGTDHGQCVTNFLSDVDDDDKLAMLARCDIE